MVHGHINEDLEIKVKVFILTENSTKTEIDAIVDTGFTGDICLSERLLDYVKLEYIGTT